LKKTPKEQHNLFKKVGQSAHSADRSLKGAANASSGASKKLFQNYHKVLQED
jgi:hypothetical protein